jgi:PEP-CTERM motif
MIVNTSLLKPLALAALLATTGAAQAVVTIYTSLASFTAATAAQGTDSFNTFLITGVTPSPITRSAGAYSYTATAPGNFFGAGTLANPALSINNATDTITFDKFTGGAQAIGGNFFGTDQEGNFLSGTVTVTATDSSGTVTQTIAGGTVNSFLGFVSSTAMTAMTLSAVQTPATLYPTLDNLVMATRAVPVPEPQTYALMLAGLGAVGFLARRRRA